MSRVELAAVGLAEALASDEIDKKDIRGNGKCEVASRRASRSVANALIDHKKYIIWLSSTKPCTNIKLIISLCRLAQLLLSANRSLTFCFQLLICLITALE